MLLLLLVLVMVVVVISSSGIDISMMSVIIKNEKQITQIFMYIEITYSTCTHLAYSKVFDEPSLCVNLIPIPAYSCWEERR